MQNRKKIVILFNGPHLSYSPTVIGLYDLLSPDFDVTIIAESPENFDNKPVSGRKIVYLERLKSLKQYSRYNKLFRLLALFYQDFSTLRSNQVDPIIFYEYFRIKKHLRRLKPDIIIAVDFKNLWYAQLLKENAEFLSLEINENDEFYKRCRQDNINSVIIQTKERYEYLFPKKKIKTFFIQNAPIYHDFSDSPKRQGLIYCGTAWNPFGFYHCLEFIRRFPQFTLTVKGAILADDRQRIETEYADCLANGKVIIDSNYSDDSEVVSYLRKFKIGFCFYNFEVEWINVFNYFSAPSGKMFKYLAAGVPVIGIDVSGLSPIKEFDCGVLIKDLDAQSIKNAIETIEANFDYYSENCLKAAKHYSFDKSAQPFIDYLNNEN